MSFRFGRERGQGREDEAKKWDELRREEVWEAVLGEGR